MSRSSKIILAILAMALLVPFYAHAYQGEQMLRSGVGVAVFSSEGQQAAFEVPVSKNYPRGPYVIVLHADWPQRWLKPNHEPRTKDGRLVSGFKLAGWMEGDSAKIVVTALVNDRSKEYASTKEQELEEQFVETYVAKIGDTIRLSDMSLYGVKPLELRIMSAKSYFPSKPLSSVTEPRKK